MRPPGPLPGTVLGLKPCSAAKPRARGLMRPTSTGMLAAGIAGWVAAGAPFEAMAPVQSDPPPGAGDTAVATVPACAAAGGARSEEHTSELQSLRHLVCRLLLEKKK